MMSFIADSLRSARLGEWSDMLDTILLLVDKTLRREGRPSPSLAAEVAESDVVDSLIRLHESGSDGPAPSDAMSCCERLLELGRRVWRDVGRRTCCEGGGGGAISPRPDPLPLAMALSLISSGGQSEGRRAAARIGEEGIPSCSMLKILLGECKVENHLGWRARQTGGLVISPCGSEKEVGTRCCLVCHCEKVSGSFT